MIPSAVGALLAILFAFVARRGSLRSESGLYVLLLTSLPLIYAFFALARGDLLVAAAEAGGILLYGGAALWGWHRAPWLVGAALLAHIPCDVVHLALARSGRLDPTMVPPGYEILCITFDGMVGLHALARARDWRLALPERGGPPT